MIFKEKVYSIIKNIPIGRVLTYKEAARLAGSPKAFRAVGNILNKNYDPQIPCHRVIRSDGKLGGYNRGQKRKIELLTKEAGKGGAMFQLKVCQQCGTVCESTVHWCPECQARKFQKITMKELIEKSGNKKIRIYFKQWPSWPSEFVWHEIYQKEESPMP